ncbi:hypothetical protein HYW76_05395 [Candidatus Pacearchaeota archaeon]|nr:hypothetical protein [Candidatus Pacearchaeota archaeon]
MSKKAKINELTNLLAIALRHKIGSIVNQNEIYAGKYTKDAEVLIEQARIISLELNLNNQDKEELKNQLKTKLIKELEQKTFIHSRKFELVDEEIILILRLLNLSAI